MNKNIPTVWNIQYDQKNFFGREYFLETLNIYLEKSVESTKLIAIVGLPGIGKTQTAKQYARVFKKNYDIVWWFYPSQDIKSQFLNLAKELDLHYHDRGFSILLNEPDETIKQVKDFLRSTPLHYLFIFDDLSSFKEIDEYIPEHHTNSRAHIIITSKNAKEWKDFLVLDKFPRATSIEIIKEITGDSDIDSADKLSKMLDDYPILISHAANTINNLSLNIDSFVNMMSNSKVSQSATELAEKSLKITLDNIQKNSPVAYQLLLFSTTLNNENIPKEILEKWFIEKKLGNVYDFNASLSLLLKYFILSKASILIYGNSNYYLYNMHDIIKKVILKRLTQTELIERTKEAILTISNSLNKKGKKVVLPEFPYLYPHIMHLSEFFKSGNLNDDSLLKLQVEVLDYYQIVERNFDKMETHAIKLSKMFANAGPCKTEVCARYNTALSGLNWWKGRHKEGSEYQKKSLKFYEINNPGSYEHIRSLIYLTSQYSSLGDIKQSRNIIEKAINYIKNFSENENFVYYHYTNAIVWQNLAIILALEGKYQQARDELKRAFRHVDALNKQFIDPEKRLATYLHFIIQEQELLLSIGEGKDQLDYLSSLYKKSISALGSKKHRLSGELLFLIGNSLNLNGKFKEAESYVQESIAILNGWVGKNYQHHLIALAHRILGDIYLNLADPIKALQEYFVAEDIYRNCYTHLEADDLSILYEKIVLASLKIKDMLMAKRYLNIHTLNFGKHHERTVRIRQYLVNF